MDYNEKTYQLNKCEQDLAQLNVELTYALNYLNQTDAIIENNTLKAFEINIENLKKNITSLKEQIANTYIPGINSDINRLNKEKNRAEIQ